MEIGRGALADTLDDLNAPSSASNPHVLSPTGQPIEYNEEYAIQVAQYLLDEGILIHISHFPFVSDGGSSVLLTPDQPTDEDDQAAAHVASSYDRRDMTDSVRQLGVNSAVSGVSAGDSPGQARQSVGSSRRGASTVSADRYRGGGHSGQAPNPSSLMRQHLRLDRPAFMATSSVFYKFAGSEDAEIAFFQSQILVSSLRLSTRATSTPDGNEATLLSSRQSNGLPEEASEFATARRSTLCLVHDLLSQRARKERVAKQFLAFPRVQEQRRQAGNTHCDLIFKM